jgi:hypothetical protein
MQRRYCTRDSGCTHLLRERTYKAGGIQLHFSVPNARRLGPSWQCENALNGGHIILAECLRLLDNADVVAILDKDFVNTLPARIICPGAVNQNNIPNSMLLVLC